MTKIHVCAVYWNILRLILNFIMESQYNQQHVVSKDVNWASSMETVVVTSMQAVGPLFDSWVQFNLWRSSPFDQFLNLNFIHFCKLSKFQRDSYIDLLASCEVVSFWNTELRRQQIWGFLIKNLFQFTTRSVQIYMCPSHDCFVDEFYKSDLYQAIQFAKLLSQTTIIW